MKKFVDKHCGGVVFLLTKCDNSVVLTASVAGKEYSRKFITFDGAMVALRTITGANELKEVA